MKIAIAGYGALGISVQAQVKYFSDVELVGVFTRRPPSSVKLKEKCSIYPFDQIVEHKDQIDVVINCMGSATDLPVTTPYLSKYFNTVDSFDTHQRFKEHFMRTDRYAKQSGKLALICCGWDPGLFSLMRAILKASMPYGKDYTFWGEGVSRGHTNAIKNIEGVIEAVQYTVPIESAVYSVRNGDLPNLTSEKMHRRVCFVVAEEGANINRIENEIKTMPAYFSSYDTEVHFIDLETFLQEHQTKKHAGSVILTAVDNFSKSIAEFSLKLSSNQIFTANILLAYAKAVNQMNKSGRSGCITVFDITACDLTGQNSKDMSDLI